MSADREDEIRDQLHGMEREQRDMEEQLSDLEGGIDEAKSTAKQRQDAPEQAPAGDWEDEAAGAQQGEDAEDAVDEGEERDSGDEEPESKSDG